MLQKRDRRTRVYRRHNERFARNCVLEVYNFGGVSVMMWGAISYAEKLNWCTSTTTLTPLYTCIVKVLSTFPFNAYKFYLHVTLFIYEFLLSCLSDLTRCTKTQGSAENTYIENGQVKYCPVGQVFKTTMCSCDWGTFTTPMMSTSQSPGKFVLVTYLSILSIPEEG